MKLQPFYHSQLTKTLKNVMTQNNSRLESLFYLNFGNITLLKRY